MAVELGPLAPASGQGSWAWHLSGALTLKNPPPGLDGGPSALAQQ